VDIRWTSDLPPETKEDFQKLLRNSQVQFGKLLQILDDEEQTLNRQESTIKDFEDPNWSHKQAFRNGDRSRIRKMKELLSFVRR
jgi:hypothetical protein